MNWAFSLDSIPLQTLGYIGPGAGFAVLGSFLALFVALTLVFVSILSFPFRLILGVFKRKHRRKNTDIDRVVVIGLDGLDPERVRKLMDDGLIPNMAKLATAGTFCNLATTCPPMSPVAWSSFSTGVNPGKHNIFDFMNRNTKSMTPELSSSRIEMNKGKPKITLLRKSIPFWKILGDHGVFSTVLRVPITFPPEKFNGLSLSAMCTPDIRGTQGSFTFYHSKTTNSGPEKSELSDGFSIPVEIENKSFDAKLAGPDTGKGALQAEFTVKINSEQNSATLLISGTKIQLSAGNYSDWITINYKAGMRTIKGICRFLLISAAPEFKMYVTPVNIDPEHPAMPISHPRIYSSYLAKLHGPYATLGLAEDTWALNEGIIDQAAFLKQTYDIHEERRKMFSESVKRSRKGFVCCVFDLTDRIQHVFQTTDDQAPEIERAYIESDKIIGETLNLIDNKTTLIVMSDHGFTHFDRGININRWLEEEGYLSVKKDNRKGDYLSSIDWSETRAYSFGLSGIYINLSGRESKGIVKQDEKDELITEIQRKLNLLKDPKTSETAIHKTYSSKDIWHGPYTNNGPDIIVGYKKGYRASWENAAGTVSDEIFCDNTKEWNGDHCIDYTLVPGSLFINRKLSDKDASPHITDIAPTILDMFGIEKPEHMDGKSLRLLTRETV